MAETWVGGAKSLVSFTSSSPAAAGILQVPFDNAFYTEGNTILRLLLGYQLITTPILDSAVPFPFMAFPTAAAAWFDPNPDFPAEVTSTSVEDAMVGDALFSSLLRWVPVRWTDGTDQGWIFHADSGGTVSVRGKRTINFTPTDNMNFGIGGIAGDLDLPPFEPGVNGHLWMKWLVQRP